MTYLDILFFCVLPVLTLVRLNIYSNLYSPISSIFSVIDMQCWRIFDGEYQFSLAAALLS